MYLERTISGKVCIQHASEYYLFPIDGYLNSQPPVDPKRNEIKLRKITGLLQHLSVQITKIPKQKKKGILEGFPFNHHHLGDSLGGLVPMICPEYLLWMAEPLNHFNPLIYTAWWLRGLPCHVLGWELLVGWLQTKKTSSCGFRVPKKNMMSSGWLRCGQPWEGVNA